MITFSLFAVMVLPSLSFQYSRIAKRASNPIRFSITSRLHFSTENSSVEPEGAAADTAPTIDIPVETEEQKYKREKLQEIADRKAQEVFVTRNTGKYECQACGYVYSEAQGYEKKGIATGTPFETIEKFRCPKCGAAKKYFVPETETLSGFKENLKFGFGTNAMTSEMKSGLIFVCLFAGFLLFMSGYLLE